MGYENSSIIADARGNPIFELPNAGPILYVMLPNGKYKVSARFKGLTESQKAGGMNIPDEGMVGAAVLNSGGAQ